MIYFYAGVLQGFLDFSMMGPKRKDQVGRGFYYCFYVRRVPRSKAANTEHRIREIAIFGDSHQISNSAKRRHDFGLSRSKGNNSQGFHPSQKFSIAEAACMIRPECHAPPDGISVNPLYPFGIHPPSVQTMHPSYVQISYPCGWRFPSIKQSFF